MFFYTLVFLTIGCALIAFSLNMIAIADIIPVLHYSHDTMNIRLGVGTVGILLIIYSLVAIQISVGNFQREKTIAFDNPSGTVTISLSAIEDFIRKLSAQLDEVKELRPNVTANKKGVHIAARIVIYSDANIPALTEKIQGILKNKIQEMLGIEETIDVQVHIVKILSRDGREKKTPKIEKNDQKKSVFRGIEYGHMT